MVLKRDVVKKRVANIAGVPFASRRSTLRTSVRQNVSIRPIPSVPPSVPPSVTSGVTPGVTPPVPPSVPPPEVLPELLWWFDYKTLKCQQKRFRGAYMYQGLQTFKSKGMCERALEKILTPSPPIPPQIPVTPPVTPPVPGMPLPEVKNIRATELRGDFARVEWDVARMPGLAYKVWLNGVAQGTAVTEPRIEFSGLKPGRRYKVEIRTQPYSRMSRQAPSKKVTYYFTTPPTPPSTLLPPPQVPPVVAIPPSTLLPGLKTIKIRSEDIGHRGTIYRAETNLGADVSQFKYDVWQTIGRLTEQIEVKGKETTNYGAISFTIPYNARTPLGRRIAIKWVEQVIAGQRYKAGWTEGVVIVGAEPPKPPIPRVPAKRYYFDDDTLRCKEIPVDKSIPSVGVHLFTSRRECQVALREHLREAHITKPREEPIRRRRPGGIAHKRQLSARAEELMRKRAFPKAVKEAIEKGLERKEAPRDIERMIEKVAKTNEPDYILRRTIAKRIGVRGTVEYKVDTDKGEIIYENADENTVNAILGMSTPTGEVIPLQIKVIR